MADAGFILQPTYRIESGRPVVHLFGRLEEGEGFLVRDHRQTPHFYVRARDAPRARELGAHPLTATNRTDLPSRLPVLRVEVPTPGDAPRLRDRLVAEGIPCFEADVRFAMRYLIDRGIRGSVEIDGAWREKPGIGRVYEDPEVRPGRFKPELSILSMDIETDPTARRLLSIALVGCGASEVLLLTGPGQEVPDGAVPCSGERDLLTRFCRRVQELDPDILTGWNVIDFDLSVLDRIAGRLGVPLHLGRGPGGLRLRPERSFMASSRASVPGRVILDGIALVRGAFIRMEEFSLEFVARKVIGEGKTLVGPGRAEEILETFRSDRPAFVAYNRKDAELVLRILERLRLLELAVERSRLTGMPLDRVSASIASFDFLYLGELRRRKFVAPSVGSVPEDAVATSGGHVLEPRPGLYRNVLVFDFKSLYPSLIRTFQIDPLGYLGSDVEEGSGAGGGSPGPIVAPNGARFRREPGILPGLLDEMFPRRERAKAQGNPVASQAIKILMNSFYGVLGTPACRFYHPALANAITGFGREILLWAQGRFEAAGREVLYGDTDSLFVRSDAESPERARRLGDDMVRRLNRDLAEHVRDTWGVESRLELEFESLYLRLMLLPLRHGTGGARKRYAGLAETGDGTEVVFTGMETVRRDWTPLARRVQEELYTRLFSDRPLEDYLQDIVRRLRAGELDDQLVYRKSLRKPLDRYTASTPPHVAAARKMSRPPGRQISYVMTVAGPEPAEERHADLDHEHYVQKQIRPVSEPVLAVLDLEFDRVIGDDSQMDLF